MRVDNRGDRTQMPEECDLCQANVKLKRFYSYGPGHQVEWLCQYCSACFDNKSAIVRSMAAMFNELEQALRGDKP